jgi:polysaccharide chain length determinant protein (PEP-CTERM system associated)
MNEFSSQAAAVARGIWRYRWVAVGVAWSVAVIGAMVVWLMPERHEARARIYVDTQTVLKPLMSGLAFQPDIDQQVRMLARTLISRPNVEKLLDNPDIGLPKDSNAPKDIVIDGLMKGIKVEQTGGNNLYAISYKDPDPARAQRLVEVLVSMFMDSGSDSKSKDSREASRFIDEQITAYEAKLSEAEGRLKDFKLRNVNVASASNQDFFARMSTLTDDINRLRVQLSAAEQSRDTLKRELAAEEPQLPVEAASAPSSLTPELDSRIDAQKRQLDDLLRRYTDEHPDVLATRRTLVQLEAQRRQEADQRARPAAPKVRSAATNPVYQRLRFTLAEAEANVASLRAQLGSMQGRLDATKSQAGQIPQAEAELAQLNRDYDVIRKNYEQLVSRREAASLGIKIDQSSPLAEFRIVEPARVQPNPVFPSRSQAAMAMMVVALLLGAAAAYGMSRFKPTIASERELREFTKRPVLGGISEFLDPSVVLRSRTDRMRVSAAFGLFLVAHVAWLAVVSWRSAA